MRSGMRHADHYLNDKISCYTSKPWDYNRVEQEFKQIDHAFAWCQASSPECTREFALYMNDFLRIRGHTAILRKWLKSALDAAEVTGNEHSKANVLQSLGNLELRLDNVDLTRQHFENALNLYEASCSQLGKANVLKRLGDLECRLDNVYAARQHFENARNLFEVASCQLGKANALHSLGDLELSLDHVDAAHQHFEDALPLYEAVCSRLGKANVQISDFELGLDSVDAARQHVQDALQQIPVPRDLELGDLASRVDNYLLPD
jgi:tetratricopeptide (TPR) repeat protein